MGRNTKSKSTAGTRGQAPANLGATVKAGQITRSLVEHYYAEVEKLGLRRGDCPEIYQAITGKVVSSHYVQDVDASWTPERVEEQLRLIRADVLKRHGPL